MAQRWRSVRVSLARSMDLLARCFAVRHSSCASAVRRGWPSLAWVAVAAAAAPVLRCHRLQWRSLPRQRPSRNSHRAPWSTWQASRPRACLAAEVMACGACPLPLRRQQNGEHWLVVEAVALAAQTLLAPPILQQHRQRMMASRRWCPR